MSESLLPKVFAVVLNYNGASVLPDCLASIFSSDYPNLEIVVVDNNSTDDSFQQARIKYSRAHFIKNSSNVGFSRGNNVGIRYALEKFADFVFILNNDATIEKSTISSLVKTATQNQSSGIISPIIFNADNESVWFAGGIVDWKKMRTTHLHGSSSASPYPSEYISGCAMLVKKEVFKKIGLFDERFFLYYEDADFSLRAKKEKFELIMDPSVKIVHAEKSNIENDSKVYWLVLSGLLFFRIHASFAQRIWMFCHTSLRKIKNYHDILFTGNIHAKSVREAFMDFKKIR